MTKVCWYPIVIVGVLVSRLSYASAEQIDICVPDQSVPPFYLVEKSRVSGLTIDRLTTLFQQHTLDHIRVRYILQPWQRCLKAIENGSVDMLVAGYSQERANKAVYPDSIGFGLNESIFSIAQICLVKKREARWDWTGKRIQGKERLVLGLESGFLIPEFDHIERTVAIWDRSKKYDLVTLGRVDAVLTVCGVADNKSIPDESKIPDELDVVFPPYIDSPVYLVFSSEYYRRHTQVASLVLETLINAGLSLQH